MSNERLAFPGQEEKQKILIVDDQVVNIKILNEIFKKDYDIIMATSGKQALQLAREQKPDLILLDIVMPDLDGYSVCRELKASVETSYIPIIFVTARDDEGNEVQGFEIGGADYITKPVNPVIVYARVKTHLMLKKQFDLLENLVNQDGLTHIANRRKFDEMLSCHFNVCQRESLPLSLLMIDVDFFKRFNDQYGHVAGDKCLQKMAIALSNEFRRPWDLCCRYGGEEFACLLPLTNKDGATSKAHSVLKVIHDLNIPHVSSDVSDRVSVSIGVASIIPSATNSGEMLIQQADAALYQSKQDGRARVTVFTEMQSD
ncbi:diguanylate cyclase [Pectobacteriaceae bacterium CE90]|nr:diguanylate cyclase [Pectobacteriaceae bacterium CE90]